MSKTYSVSLTQRQIWLIAHALKERGWNTISPTLSDELDDICKVLVAPLDKPNSSDKSEEKPLAEDALEIVWPTTVHGGHGAVVDGALINLDPDGALTISGVDVNLVKGLTPAQQQAVSELMAWAATRNS